MKGDSSLPATDDDDKLLRELAKTDIYAAIMEVAANTYHRRPTADGLEHPTDVRRIRALLQKEPEQAKRWDYEVMVGSAGALFTGGTPLHLAARQNLSKVAEVLLESGADVNARSDEQPHPPLESAFGIVADLGVDLTPDYDERLAKVVEVLLRHGADPNLTVGNSPALSYVIHYWWFATAVELVTHGADVNAKPRGKAPPIWDACSSAPPALIELMVKRGAKVNAVYKGKSALDVARDNLARSVEGRQQVVEDVIALLIAAGAKTHKELKGRA